MAWRAQPVNPYPGLGAASLVAALILGTLVAVALQAEAARGFQASDWAALRVTLIQATLSASCSIVLAIPVARALARRRFQGRSLLITLMGAPFILPVIVAVLGLLQVFGRSGWISQMAEVFGLPNLSIYGLHGVVLAHVFFNLPLATRLFLQGWQEVPAERFRLAAQLGFDARTMFRVIELPMLLRVLPGAFAVIFAICLTSFAVVLILGGGPKVTTIELAIYQAFTYEFDLGRAALLSSMQLVITALAAFAALKFSQDDGFGAGLNRPIRRWDQGGKALDLLWITVAALFLLLPLASVVLSGLWGLLEIPAAVFRAAVFSVFVAISSTIITLALALPMATTLAAGRFRSVEIVGILGLAASPLVVGTGLFIAIRQWADPIALALPVTALVNAAMALPFALRILIPAAKDAVVRHGRLARSLDVNARSFFTSILLPHMRPQIAFAAGLSAALSMGDLGVIALFADAQNATLPLQIYRLMGAYQMQAAAGASLLLLMLSVGIFRLLDRGGRRHVEA